MVSAATIISTASRTAKIFSSIVTIGVVGVRRNSTQVNGMEGCNSSRNIDDALKCVGWSDR